MKALHGADEPTDGFRSLVLDAVRGAPRWPAPSGTHAAQLAAERAYVERFARMLWVEAWAAGAGWMSGRMDERIVLCDAEMYESAKRWVAEHWAAREAGDATVPGDDLQP